MGRDRIRQALGDFTLQTQADRDRAEGRESPNSWEWFDPWRAASPGLDNAKPSMLGVNTNGSDSTRVSMAQYFFDPQTQIGNMYVLFRRKGSRYVYEGVPVYAARRFYNALSKGKSIGPMNGLEQYGYRRAADHEDAYFRGESGSTIGRSFSNPLYANTAAITDDLDEEYRPEQRNYPTSVQPELELDFGAKEAIYAWRNSVKNIGKDRRRKS
jgi:hypothetical protein